MPRKAKTTEFGTVSQEAKDIFSALLESLKGKTALPWSPEYEAQRPLLAELKAAKLVEYDGKGRKPPTFIKALGRLEDAVIKSNRGPRKGTGTKPPQRASKGPLMPSDFAGWEDYFMATRPEEQRKYEQSRQAISDDKILAEAKRLKNQSNGKLSLAEAVTQAEADMKSTFEEHLRRRFGDTLVRYLGIPEVGPDTPDKV